MAALLLAVYPLMVRWLERREVVELAPRAGSVQFPAGAAMGVALMARVYGMLWVANIATFGAGTGMQGLGAGFVRCSSPPYSKKSYSARSYFA